MQIAIRLPVEKFKADMFTSYSQNSQVSAAASLLNIIEKGGKIVCNGWTILHGGVLSIYLQVSVLQFGL